MKFITKVTYNQELPSGKIKKTSELLLVQADSFKEAEELAIKTVQPRTAVGTEFTVASVAKKNIDKVITSDGEYNTFYQCKVAYITLDEATEKEKKTKSIVYVVADNFKGALDKLKEFMSDTLGEYSILEIKETAILEFINN